MNRSHAFLRRSALPLLTVLLLGLSGRAATGPDPLSGGFELTVALAGTESGGARLEIATRGCKEPHRARVTARLHGEVNGTLKASPTPLTAVGPGRFEILSTPVESGILEVTGRYRGMTSVVLVSLNDRQEFIATGARSGRLSNGYDYRILHRAARTADFETRVMPGSS